ncbi:MAG: hypothetical protein ACP5NV_05685 [Candidatus Woesearchaeota archaeon]
MLKKNSNTLKIVVLVFFAIALFLMTPAFLQSFIKNTFNFYDIIFITFIKIIFIIIAVILLFFRYESSLPNRVAHYLIFLILFFGVAHLLVYKSNIFSVWFDLDSEEGIPTYFSAMMLFTAFLIGMLKLYCTKDFFKKLFWTILSLLLLFLSFDEIFQLHESIARRLLSEQWYYVAGPIFIAVIILLWFIAYKKNMDSELLKKIILGFALIFIGAVLIEHIGTLLEYGGAYYVIEVLIEEILELTGATILIYALMNEVLNKNVRLAED